MDEPRDTNTNITRNKLGIRISFEEHVTAIRILFHYIRTRIITFVPPPAKSSLVHPLPPFIVNYCQMASPREPTNGPTPISLSPSLSLSFLQLEYLSKFPIAFRSDGFADQFPTRFPTRFVLGEIF